MMLLWLGHIASQERREHHKKLKQLDDLGVYGKIIVNLSLKIDGAM